MSKKDTLYRSGDAPVKPFEFNQKVVDVFPDMIERSVPGYPLTISMISVMANQYVQEHSNIYDLGCSLGAASLAMQQCLDNKSCKIIAVDNSEAMIETCKQTITDAKPGIELEFVLQDIQQTEIKQASVVVMNFTLQFIPKADRLALLQKIYDGLLPGGVLILSEKTVFENDRENQILEQLHYQMKGLNGYEQMEIASKREALENVLVPESIQMHQDRLQQAGFKQVYLWLQCLNFVSFLAIK